jgi:hypothetical protein
MVMMVVVVVAVMMMTMINDDDDGGGGGDAADNDDGSYGNTPHGSSHLIDDQEATAGDLGLEPLKRRGQQQGGSSGGEWTHACLSKSNHAQCYNHASHITWLAWHVGTRSNSGGLGGDSLYNDGDDDDDDDDDDDVDDDDDDDY